MDRTTALLAALATRKAAQELMQELGPKSTSEQGSMNAPNPCDEVMIALLEQQKLLHDEIKEMRRKMRDMEISMENSQRLQETPKTSQEHKSKSQRTERSKSKSQRIEVRTKSQKVERSKSSKWQKQIVESEKSSSESGARRSDSSSESAETSTPLKHYDGTSDPLARVNSFTTAMLYAGTPDEVRCRAFPSTLNGDAQLWFSDLPPGSISSFKQLSKKFTSYFTTSRKIKRTAHCLKNVIQGNNESLKDFLIRFTKEARQIQGLKTDVALSYLTDNLRRKLFCCSITKKPPETMAELIARQGGARERGDHRCEDRGHRGDDGRRHEGNMDNVAGTIHVIAGGVVWGTEADSHTKKRLIRFVMKLEHELKKPRPRQPSPQITFSDEDFAGQDSDHEDPMTPLPSTTFGDKEEEPTGGSPRFMNTELVDPRGKEEERCPNPEGEMEAIALTEQDPSKVTKIRASLSPQLKSKHDHSLRRYRESRKAYQHSQESLQILGRAPQVYENALDRKVYNDRYDYHRLLMIWVLPCKVFNREGNLRRWLPGPWLLRLVFQLRDKSNLPLLGVGVFFSAPNYSSYNDVDGSGNIIHVPFMALRIIPSMTICVRVFLPTIPSASILPSIFIIPSPQRLRFVLLGLFSCLGLVHLFKCDIFALSKFNDLLLLLAGLALFYLLRFGPRLHSPRFPFAPLGPLGFGFLLLRCLRRLLRNFCCSSSAIITSSRGPGAFTEPCSGVLFGPSSCISSCAAFLAANAASKAVVRSI
ncbi:uncharacterized protein G2W53_040910 [Senna tora]|uniref:Retrotransposon gag domain-containing protein n=1 Tax=Senna tora TaxID=362788 RepID=A0A834W2F5_9FABA|nr:uncharacterized protein G2W53_040910 [Senna tora]